MIPVTHDNAIGLVIVTIFQAIGLIVTYFFIRHKQETGEFKGISTLFDAILFTIFVFGTVILWIIFYENVLLPWLLDI